MNCVDAIREVFANETGVLSTNQVADKIYAKYTEQPWKKSTMSAHLIGLSVNHPSGHHYPWARKQAFLFSLGNGRYRCWNPEQDGKWVDAKDGPRLVDDNEGEVTENGYTMETGSFTSSVSLERDLEKSLVIDLGQLEHGLKLYQQEGLFGNQLDTGVVGRIDILALDKDNNYVVIELKAGEADDRVCGQIMRYMGWVQRELINKGETVRGIIVASSFHERIKYAVDAAPNIKLKRYEVQFTYLD